MILKMDWDTDYFGIKCGKVVIENSLENIETVKQEMLKYDFVSIQNPGNRADVNCLIGKYTDAYLVDINIQLKKAINKQFLVNKGTEIKPSLDMASDDKEMLSVEESDFVFSKFVCDDKLREKNGYLVYKEWLINACSKKEKYFALHYFDDKLVGYVLFGINNDVATIELVKVEREYMGQHIATNMINEIEDYLYQRNIKYLIVGTQVNNIPAINLYHSLGFKELSRTSVFHWWNK